MKTSRFFFLTGLCGWVRMWVMYSYMLYARSHIHLLMISFSSMDVNVEAVLQDLETKEQATIHLSKVTVIYICFI